MTITIKWGALTHFSQLNKTLYGEALPPHFIEGYGNIDIFTNIYLKNGPNVGKYSIQGASGYVKLDINISYKSKPKYTVTNTKGTRRSLSQIPTANVQIDSILPRLAGK